MKKFNIKNVSVATWVRTALLAVALINQLLSILGINALPFSDAMVEQFVTFMFTAVTAIIAFWKNQSFTKAAQNADVQMKMVKTKKKQGDYR
ncbi:phage lysis protein, holin [Listeria grandensis FSL F6-0971]|uniref:Phage lysis protein, holin n=1 Tax=Listeria grandensis FSL F6-0971 TaxID=1265819 RepID=W7BFY5_9LIST|nr:phage holin [Listeria grandensis]EUJ24777.1 phage lysis protein, holin [Listeria grandensis FSL F6-0971]